MRCLPGTLSNQSSSSCRAGCQRLGEGTWAECAEVDVPAPKPAPKAARPVLSLETNDRLANRSGLFNRCMSTSCIRDANGLAIPPESSHAPLRSVPSDLTRKQVSDE